MQSKGIPFGWYIVSFFPPLKMK